MKPASAALVLVSAALVLTLASPATAIPAGDDFFRAATLTNADGVPNDQATATTKLK